METALKLTAWAQCGYIIKRIWVLCKPPGTMNETSPNGLKSHLQPTSTLSLTAKGKCKRIYWVYSFPLGHNPVSLQIDLHSKMDLSESSHQLWAFKMLLSPQQNVMGPFYFISFNECLFSQTGPNTLHNLTKKHIPDVLKMLGHT